MHYIHIFECIYVYNIHYVLLKMLPFYFLNDSVKNELILIIFDTQHPEKI